MCPQKRRRKKRAPLDRPTDSLIQELPQWLENLIAASFLPSPLPQP